MWEMLVYFCRETPFITASVLFIACAVCVSSFVSLVFTERKTKELVRHGEACVKDLGVFYVVFAAPVLEEVLFRFVPLAAILLYQEMQVTAQTWIIAGVVSILFGLGHRGLGQIFSGMILGFLLSVVFLLYVSAHDSFVTGFVVIVCFHMVWNILVVLNIYRWRRAGKPGSD